MSSTISTGRGGAGNFRKLSTTSSSSTSRFNISHLVTPHLKSTHFSTGRGGSGNMAKAVTQDARRAQDLEPVMRADRAAVLWGRGGGGNVWRSEGSSVGSGSSARSVGS